jgi:hypothetical protein
VLTPARLAAWDQRTARAVVVDISESMRIVGDGGLTAAQAAETAAEQEIRTAAFGRRFETADLGAGVRRAVAWLDGTPPARREVVVVADFHRGSFGDETASGVPAHVGLRLIAVGKAEQKRRIEGADVLSIDDESARAETIELTTAATSVVLHAGTRSRQAGLRFVLPPGSTNSGEAIVRTIARAGTPAGSTEEPMVFQFADAPAAAVAPVGSGWMLGTVLRMIEDPGLRRRSAHEPGPARVLAASDPWVVVLSDRKGKPLLRTAAAGKELVFDVAAAPDTLFAAAVVRAALVARTAGRYSEQEIARIDSRTLSKWDVPPAPPGILSSEMLRRVESTDAPWLWAGTLILLACEQRLRARRARHQVEAARVAA